MQSLAETIKQQYLQRKNQILTSYAPSFNSVLNLHRNKERFSPFQTSLKVPTQGFCSRMKTGLSAAGGLRCLFTVRVELVTRCVCHQWLLAWSFQLLGLWEYMNNTPSSFPLGRLQFIHASFSAQSWYNNSKFFCADGKFVVEDL